MLPFAFAILLIVWVTVLRYATYWATGIQLSGLERRRFWANSLLYGIAIGAAVPLVWIGVPGAEFAWIGLAVVAILALQLLRRGGHWLVTLTPEEQAALPARRAAFAANRPKLVGVLVVLVVLLPVMTVTLILLVR